MAPNSRSAYRHGHLEEMCHSPRAFPKDPSLDSDHLGWSYRLVAAATDRSVRMWLEALILLKFLFIFSGLRLLSALCVVGVV